VNTRAQDGAEQFEVIPNVYMTPTDDGGALLKFTDPARPTYTRGLSRQEMRVLGAALTQGATQ
jgi:hypothetical protein